MEACGKNGSGSAAEFVAREAEVRRERGPQHAALWQNLTRFPSVASGWLHPAAPSASSTEIEATIFTKQRDLVGRKNRLVGRNYQCGSGGVRAVGGFGWEVKDVQLSSPSPSRGLLALVTNHTPEPPSPQQAKPALETETFGSLVWSRDETWVAYLAEPKREEKDSPSFWDVTPKADNGDAKDDKAAPNAILLIKASDLNAPTDVLATETPSTNVMDPLAAMPNDAATHVPN
ncbi:uncharacterized protein ACA1_044130 [Acanthamoeba castellanii str. Neff]|uniref:Uncharacterized protein n=1 Tax=Acanthamoeba castellanii (strain ATCC 30010 / Neff) TaxID=1257118 RepID=L8HEE1_ACACF|nr:uncharacterized protein ACA1_044130 [Acanthamoeba castellanii str. Neff]ELR23118.1 hypothetical protein ACA1_044130 [Acanthamoeba castellanii str. Neff]